MMLNHELAAAGLLTASTGPVSRTGTQENGSLDLGCGGEGQGQGRYSRLAATPLWVTPVPSPSLAHTPRQRLAAPQWTPRRWPWDPRSSPTSRGSQGSELSSSTRPGAAGAAVVPKRWWLPTDQTICPLRSGVRVGPGGVSTRAPGGLATGRRDQGGGRTAACCMS